ncbi:MAG: NAD(P)/FAD-dependent oxidoreductase [Actinomycetota bacterium]|nr:NAD(P)/FAD-dependent oxidoreductase [Actinomycetota bacterium]
MDETWDVVVVGAGPAGASAALSTLYANPDARVLMVDRDDFPRDKPCGDGIAPHVLDVLSSVGVTGVESGYAGVHRLVIGFASGPSTGGAMARAAYVIPRSVFDARLVDAAVHRGAQLCRHRIRTVAPANDGERLVLDGSIRAGVVIAADGASSLIRRQLSPRRTRATHPPDVSLSWWWPKRPGGEVGHTAVAIRGYAPVPASRAGQQVIVFSDPDGSRGSPWPAYAWSFPIGDGRANVGYGELLRPGQPLTRRHLLDRLDELLPDAGAGGQSWRAHHLPLSTGRPRQPDGRILFAGDAMNLINPVTGEGIFYAVTSGVLAGRAALSSDDPGRRYRAALRRGLGAHLRHTDAAALLARSPRIVAAAVHAANRTASTFDDLVELGLGRGKLTPSALAGIAGALLRC